MVKNRRYLSNIAFLSYYSMHMKRPTSHSARPHFIGDFRVPDWWDCQWRRTSCGRPDCTFCGKRGSYRQAAVENGAYPAQAFTEAGDSIKETIDILAAEVDADDWHEESAETAWPQPPEPDQFALYSNLLDWYDDVMDVFHGAFSEGVAWAQTDAAADVTWYAATLLAKTYRQLTTRWEFEHAKDLASDVDYIYTNYVLGECLRILRRSLKELAFLPSPDQRTLRTAEILLAQFEPQVMHI